MKKIHVLARNRVWRGLPLDAGASLLVMAEQQIGRLPVVDDGGQLVGLVTLSSVALHSQKADAAMVAAKTISSRSARARSA